MTQIDLPRGARSGLRHAIEVLSEVDEISFNFFLADDVVRHPVVARIVQAYEVWESEDQKQRKLAEQRRRAEQEAKEAALVAVATAAKIESEKSN